METVEKILKALEDFSKKETFLKTYGDVFSYAEKYGGVTSNAFQKHLAEVLVDGYLPKDEAEKAIKPALIKMSEDISYKAASVQQLINSESGVGLKAIQSGVNHDKINGIVNRVSSEPYDDIKWIVKEPVINFAQAAVSDTQKANMEWQSKAGLKPRIERKVVGECCKWCSDLAGVYEYPDGVPDDIYKRHERCRCVTEYIGNGKRQNVWTKKENDDKINAQRKELLKTFNMAASSKEITQSIINNHRLIAEFTPFEIKTYLEESGQSVKPLSRGEFKGVSFENGGGFKVNFGGDGLFQYHPAGGRHHGGVEYWKVRNGEIIKRYDRDGNEID